VRWFTVPARGGGVLFYPKAGSRTLFAFVPSPPGARHAVSPPAGFTEGCSYRVLLAAAGKAPEETTAVFTYTAPPGDRATPFTFVVYGDNRSRPEKHRAVTTRILEGPRPRFLVNTGDLTASGGDSLGWHEEFFAPGEPLFALAPILATPGNHDARGGQSHAPSALWFANLTLPGNGEAEEGRGRWWCVRAGGVLLIGLDSTDPGAKGQTDWLRRTIAAADPGDFVVVCLHHPLYSWGGHGSDAQAVAAWGRLLDDPKVDLVFAGHNHFYQRTFPLRGGQATTTGPGPYLRGAGTVHCVAGGGGAPLYSPRADRRVAALSESCHFVRVEYAPGTLTCTAITPEGTQIDKFVIEKAAPAQGGAR
jgi:acid phosphatase type 7